MKKMSLNPNILVSENLEGWAVLAAKVISQEVSSAISSRGVCYIMLTGGNTAERLYHEWAKSSTLPLEHICFLFGDERCVPPGHADSNYALVMKTLLANEVPSGCSIARIVAENPDREAAARAYEKLIPKVVDIILLGMGADGHIASLFPHSPALCSTCESVVPVTGPKSPHERLTVTPRVIARARSVFLLVTGKEKGRILAEALKPSANVLSIPVCLVLGGTWLLDDEAASQFLNCDKQSRDES
jgi:6-phosphogluconolactonase